MPITRRHVLKAGFWSGAGLAVAGGAASFLRMVYPNANDSDVYTVNPEDVPEPGGVPFRHEPGRFLLVHVKPGEGSTARGEPGSGGLLALWWRCPHLGCAVRYDPRTPESFREATSDDEGRGIACRCHEGLFTTAGVRVFGPTPRSLDTALCRVTARGHVLVDMLSIQPGDYDNPRRAIPYTPNATYNLQPKT